MGVNLVKNSEKLGMIIDYLHLNTESFSDVAKVTTKPIFVTRGNVHVKCGHVRNYNDQQLKLIKERNGVLGLTVMHMFLNDEREKASINDIIEHIIYLRDLIRINHIGFGFDFCYYLGSHTSKNKVVGLEHIDRANAIIELLKTNGFTDEEITKISYKNMQRVINENLKQI